jgi:PAS domain-containing protein
MPVANTFSDTALVPCGMAFYSWDLSTDKVYGDAVLADLFGFDAVVMATGLSMMTIIEKIHVDDRPSVAESLHRAIVSGTLRQEKYRIAHERRGIVEVQAVGRCLRDGGGTPSFYNGSVIDLTEGMVTFTRDSLETHCQSALDIAETRGNELAARYLSSALRAIGCNGKVAGAR